MGLVVIGMCIYLLFPIILFVYLIVYISKNGKKEGFQKTVKSKTVIISVVLIFLCSGLFISSFIPRSGNRLFRVFILEPIPKSVKILDSYDGGANFYPHTCLHFTVSPDDFQLILESKDWEIDSDKDIRGFTCLGNEKKWGFYPPSQKNDVIIYSLVPRERDREILITNAQMTEVYYQYYDGNLP
jgi:hypothetical protein